MAEHFLKKPLSAAAKALVGHGMTAVVGGVPISGSLPGSFKARQALAMRALVGSGMSPMQAAAIVGNMSQESSLNPTASSDHGAHIGLMQLDKARQAQFARDFGYAIGSKSVSARQQFLQQLRFAQLELRGGQRGAARHMAAAHGLAGMTRAFEQFDERPGDHSFARRLAYARQAYAYGQALLAASARPIVMHNSVHNQTHIDEIKVVTQEASAAGVATGIRGALSAHPLLAPHAQHKVILSTHGEAG